MAFSDTPIKAWERQVDLVVYDPARAPSAALLEQGAEQFGLQISQLHMDFEIKRSVTYAENTATFKVYNASEQTRRQIQAPGMRVRFGAGYRDQGGPVGIFWGSILPEVRSYRQGNDWITEIPCISSLTESTGSEDIATWAEKNPKASMEAKQQKITSALNRIPVSLGYGRDVRIRQVLRELSTISGLALYGDEGMPTDLVFPNGWVYVGGIRGAFQTMDSMLRARGWTLVIDNTTLLVLPLNGGNLTTTAAYLTYATGLLKVEPKNKTNVPPKLDKDGKRLPVPKAYDFECLLWPKIGPNTLVQIDVESVREVLLVAEVEYKGNNYGGDFKISAHGNVWTGPGDTYRKAT